MYEGFAFIFCEKTSCVSWKKMIYFFCEQNRQCVLPQEISDTRFAEAKMEAGESPARSRHCIDGALSVIPLNVRHVWEGR